MGTAATGFSIALRISKYLNLTSYFTYKKSVVLLHYCFINNACCMISFFFVKIRKHSLTFLHQIKNLLKIKKQKNPLEISRIILCTLGCSFVFFLFLFENCLLNFLHLCLKIPSDILPFDDS